MTPMPAPLLFPLQSIRTDGWFERIGEGIGSFQALCDIIGARFFAFAMITGARITALTVDRRNPDNTLVDFTVGGSDGEVSDADCQRLTLADFRRRLVSALVTDDPAGPPPQRATDTEALQLHIGVRFLLLAPLYGMTLLECTVDGPQTTLRYRQDGVEQGVSLESFRARLRAQVQDELERVSKGAPRGAIDLAKVAEAEKAADRGDFVRVLELLGSWPAPLAIFLRTPEGQLLGDETRATIARGLGLLGSACIALEEVEKGEEVLRLAVQYAGDGGAAADIYLRLGSAMLDDQRPGEAIGPLRRAVNLGAPGDAVWRLLVSALVARERYVAGLGAYVEALRAGVPPADLADAGRAIRDHLGEALAAWEQAVDLDVPLWSVEER